MNDFSFPELLGLLRISTWPTCNHDYVLGEALAEGDMLALATGLTP